MNNEFYIKGTEQGKNQAVKVNKGLVLDRNSKRVINLSKNETVYSQGDGIIKIAPFDNYYLFTIYSEINLENVPVDLNNMGKFFLTFKDKSSEVRIENYTNTADISPSSGQILFRISQENAEKILSLETNIFYITSMIVDANSNSDETVVYSGKFIEYNAGNVVHLEDTISELKSEIETITKERIVEKEELNKKITELTEAFTKLSTEYNSVKEDLKTYKESYEELVKSMPTDTQIEEKSNEQVIQEVEEVAKKNNILTLAKVSPDKALKKKSMELLKQNIIGINTLVKNTGSTTKGDNILSLNSETTISEKQAKLNLSNIKVKSGVFFVFEFMYTKYEDITTSAQAEEYNSIVSIYESIKTSIDNNSANNVECSIIYSETDYGNIINKYNIIENTIAVVKNGVSLGTVSVNSTKTTAEIITEIEEIIEENND